MAVVDAVIADLRRVTVCDGSQARARRRRLTLIPSRECSPFRL